MGIIGVDWLEYLDPILSLLGTVERCHRYRAALGMLGGTSLRLGSAVKTPSSEVTVFGFSAYLSLDLSIDEFDKRLALIRFY